MAELKSAFQAAWDRYFKGVSKASKFNDVLANAAITETQFYARERLAKNLLESRAARLSSRFGHNGIIKGSPVGLMATASLPTTNGINKADAILQQRMARVAHSLPPTNFFPPAVIQSKALLPKALRGMFHDAPSGVLDTDQVASDNILEEKLKRLDRIRAFGRATKASGFSRYAKAEAQLNEDIDKRNEYERERATNARLAESRGSIRNRKERLMLMRELPAFFRNSKMSTKDLRSMAKGFRQISKIPIIGSFASNPALAAITATIGGFASVMNSANSANEVTKKWRNYENLYGKPTERQEWNARLAGIKDPARIAQIYGELAAKFGGDPETFLLSQGLIMRGMDNRTKQYHAEAMGFDADTVRLAEIYAGAPAEESDIVDARMAALGREQKEGEKSGSGFRRTLRSMQLRWIPFQKDLEARGWSWNKILALSNLLMFGGQFVGNEIGNAVWDEVHDTAEIDDRYRAGMYDNSVTNNDASRNVSLQVNVASPQITTTGDPVDFAKGISIIGSRALSEYQSVIENTDTKRKQ